MSPQLAAFINGPARSWVVSNAYALWSIIVFAVGLGFTEGKISSFTTLGAYLHDAAFPLFMALIFGLGPYARARQAVVAQTSIVAGPTSTSFPNPAPPAQIVGTIVANPAQPEKDPK